MVRKELTVRLNQKPRAQFKHFIDFASETFPTT